MILRVAILSLVLLFPFNSWAQGFTVPLPSGDTFIPNDMPPDELGGG